MGLMDLDMVNMDESDRRRKRELDPGACIAGVVRDARMKVAEAFVSVGRRQLSPRSPLRASAWRITSKTNR